MVRIASAECLGKELQASRDENARLHTELQAVQDAGQEFESLTADWRAVCSERDQLQQEMQSLKSQLSAREADLAVLGQLREELATIQKECADQNAVRQAAQETLG
jgi:hypothetical protein